MYASTSHSSVNASATAANYIPRTASPLSRSRVGTSNNYVSEEEERVQHHQSFSSIPGLVAPIPRYASVGAGSSSLSQYSSNRSGLEQQQHHQSQPLLDEEGEDELGSMSRQNNAHSVSAAVNTEDYSSVLPKLGSAYDSQPALDKLDRLKRQNESKQKWRRRMLMSASTNSDHERGNTDGDDDSISSSFNLYGEVRLAISSLPGFTVLSSKARSAFDREGSPGNENVSGKGLRPDESRGSLPFRFGSQRRKSIVPPQAEQKVPLSEPLLTAQNDGVPDLPQVQNTESGMTPLSQPTSNSTPPELMPLKEERKIEEATDILTNDSTKGHLIKPKADRPRLMIQSPTEKVDPEILAMTMMQSPENMQPEMNDLSTLLSKDREDANLAINGNRDSSARPSSSPGPCDAVAAEAAEQCRRNMSRPSIFDEIVGSDDMRAGSINTHSSLDSGAGSASDSEGSTSSDEEGQMEEQIHSLNLEHGTQMTRKQEKRLLRQLRRDARKRKAQRGGNEAGNATGGGNAGRVHRRTASLTNHISTGLHYASSQSRNRRAMEKYSPHPSRPASTKPWQNVIGPLTNISGAVHPNSIGGNISRSSTPANAPGVGSERSSLSLEDGVNAKDIAGSSSHPGSIRDGIPQMSSGGPLIDQNEEDIHRTNLLRRWGTNQSSASNSLKGASFKKRFFSLRRGNRQQPSDVLEEDLDQDSPQQEHESAEKELEKALGKIVAEEAPEELKEQFEFDVLYENQRGMLFFGIPKFSSKTLFQWDPAPWTNTFNKNSAYNIINAQLPNPSWEWVHPEWMIDMSGDVDESGWQYSYNFGQFSLNLFSKPDQNIPRANAKGNEITNERFNKVMGDLEKRKKIKEDDGFEALKRSAISRQAKWSGIPTQNTYVRRRRWIRLRRRKPMELPPGTSNTPKTGTPLGMSKTSNDWAHLMKPEAGSKPASVKADKINGNMTWSNDADDQLSMSAFEEGSSSSSSVSSSDIENLKGTEGESGFLPRRLEGNLKNGRDPTQVRNKAGDRKELARRKRHAREFTGTIRELKSLLPAIMDRKGGRSHRSYSVSHQMRSATDRQKQLWLLEIDARNPFLSWSIVRRRLEDDDLAFASTSLRARERRYAKRQLEKQKQATTDVAENGTRSSGLHWEHFELTKDALIEINFRRVLRVLKACKLDRQKVQLWKIWLNVDQMNSNYIEPSRNEDLIQLGLAASSAAASDSLIKAKDELAKLAQTRWRSAFTPADPSDVWDVVERRLDRLLLTFEFQNGRAAFLRLLLTIHAVSHPNHRFKPSQSHLKFANQGSQQEADMPSALLPNGFDDKPSSSGDEWSTARVPRLEFWSDLIDCARSLMQSTAPTQSILLKNQQDHQQVEGVVHAATSDIHASISSPSLGSPIILPALTFAMTPLSRSTTPVLGPSVTSPQVHRGSISSPSANATAAGSGPRRLSHSSFTSSPPMISSQLGPNSKSMRTNANQSHPHGNDPFHLISGSPSNHGSPLFRPSTHHYRQQLDTSEQNLLANLLRLPVQKQKDVLVQMRSSVFENKVDHSQPHTDSVRDEMKKTTSAMIGEIEGGEEGMDGDETMMTIKHIQPDTTQQHDEDTTLLSEQIPIQHTRTDSELVQRLSQAVEEH